MNRSAKLLATSEAGLAVQIGLQIVCGLILGFSYSATTAGAHASSEAIRAGAFTHVVAGIHYWGAQLMMLHSALHLTAMLWSGCYRGAWTLRWYLALGVCLCCFALMVTGNLLPFDRHGVQSAVTEAAVAGRTPLFGPPAAEAMLHGKEFGPETLSTWYLAHARLLPLALLVLCGVFFASRPYVEAVRRNVIGVAAPAIASVALGFALRAPIGGAAGPADYTSFDAIVNWYAWPMHGALRAFDTLSPGLGWIGAAALPALVVGFLVALPRICERVTPMFVQAVFAAVVLVFGALGVCFGGLPASLLNRDYIPPEIAYVSPKGGAPIDAKLAAQGRVEFAKAGCRNCHGEDGVGGYSGPSLTAEGRKHPDAAWLKKWIADPKSLKPGATMPGFPDLGDDRLSALAEFVRSQGGG